MDDDKVGGGQAKKRYSTIVVPSIMSTASGTSLVTSRVSPRNLKKEQVAIAQGSNNNQLQEMQTSLARSANAAASVTPGDQLKAAPPASHPSATDERSVSSKLPQPLVSSPGDSGRMLTTYGKRRSSSRRGRRRKQKNYRHKSERNIFAVLMQQGQEATVEADALRREVAEAHKNASLVAVGARKDALQLVQARTTLLKDSVDAECLVGNAFYSSLSHS